MGFCHHKCGTIYLNRVFNDICIESNVRPVNLDKDDAGLSYSKKFIFFPNGDYQKHIVETKHTNYKAFHIVRDLRDMIVSGYFSHKYSHATQNEWGKKFLIPHRNWLNTVSEEEGIMEEILKGYALNKISEWNFSDPNIKEIKFEDMIADPFKTFSEVSDFLQIDVSAEKLKEIIEKNSFENLSKGRKPGEEDKSSHFRKGTPGDWKNHFTEEHVKVFKEKWGDLLIKTGYEKDNEWTL